MSRTRNKFLLYTLILLFTLSVVSQLDPHSVALGKGMEEIVIGASLPLTGAMAGAGRDLQWAYELAVGRANASGGIFVKDEGKKVRIRLVLVDDGCNPMKAASMIERLINREKVDLLLGNTTTLANINSAMVAEKYQTYYHSSTCWPNVWLEKKFRWSTVFFMSLEQACEVPFKILESIGKRQRPRKLALVIENTFGGKNFANASRSVARKNGHQFAVEIKLPVGSTDYSGEVSKLKDAGVDGILLYANVRDCETLVRRLKKDKANIPFLQTWKGGWSGKFGKDLGKDAQYILSDGFWSMEYPYEGARELGNQYYNEFGDYSVNVGLPYALCQILFQAVEKAGTADGARVRRAVLTNKFDTVMGRVKYNREGVAIFQQIGAQWWNGKQRLVYPLDYATRQVELAPAWDQR